MAEGIEKRISRAVIGVVAAVGISAGTEGCTPKHHQEPSPEVILSPDGGRWVVEDNQSHKDKKGTIQKDNTEHVFGHATKPWPQDVPTESAPSIDPERPHIVRPGTARTYDI